MDGHLVRLARRARGEQVGFMPASAAPLAAEFVITDEPAFEAHAARQDTITADAPSASMPPRALVPQGASVQRRERAKPLFERDNELPRPAASVAEVPVHSPVIADATLERAASVRAPSFSFAQAPSVGGALRLRTSVPGAPPDVWSVDVPEIASEILEERPHPGPPPPAGKGDVRVGKDDPHPDSAPHMGEGEFRVRVPANAPRLRAMETGRVRTRSRDTVADPRDIEPVRITIGRIEVRAPAPAPPAPPASEPAVVPRLSLAEYLQRRDREGGR